MPISSAAAKAKGRALQQWLARLIIDVAAEAGLELTEKDVRSTSMGVGGPDLQLSQRASDAIGLDFECKNEREPKNLAGRYWELAGKNPLPTVAVFKRTGRRKSTDPVVVMSLDLLAALAPEIRSSDISFHQGPRVDLLAEFERNTIQNPNADRVLVFTRTATKTTRALEPVAALSVGRFTEILRRRIGVNTQQDGKKCRETDTIFPCNVV